MTSAQNGIITGSVVDNETKEKLIGATVRLQEASLGSITDLNGFYAIRNVPPGKYTAVFSYLGYEDVTIKDVEVKENERVTLDVVMSTNSVVMSEVTIVEYRKTNTVAAVLLEVRQAKQVVSGVSSQQIQKSQDNNAAQVVQRVPGVTIVENRFVMIRGLNERYNSVMVNNVTAPSTEIDRRTFSFDLISSSALDRMLIFKSGSADLPGDFAGGVIKMYTIEPDDPFFKINVGVGYRVNTTGEEYFQSKGSPTDFLGFDNGFRQLPKAFPSTFEMQDAARNSSLRKFAADLLPNNYEPIRGTALPDHSIGFSFGRRMKLGGKQLSTVNIVNYSTSYQNYLRDFYRYFEWTDFNRPIELRFRFDDRGYEKATRISILSNWRLRLNENNSISFKNLFNQIGENETILRRGSDFIQRPGDRLANYLLGYRARSICLSQLEGNHDFSKRKSLRWVLGGSFIVENEPDLRRFRTFQPAGQNEAPFQVIYPPSSNLFETGRYYGKLFEIAGSHGIDYALTLHSSPDGTKKTLLRGGYLLEYRYRDFSSRYVSTLYPGFSDPAIGDSLSKLPLSIAFRKENYQPVNGLVLEEGTRPIDSYTASSLTASGYVSAEIPLGRLDLAVGFRGEFNDQRVDGYDDSGPVEARNTVLAPLPFLNAGYSIKEGHILRLAYSRTINRPEFRELAPFLFYDYKLEAARFGNPRLTPAFIHNVDLRYELYPRPGETFNIGLFYKYFDNPIENKTVVTTEQPNFSYINADFAWNYGAEVEFRKSFRGLTNSGFIDHFSINANAALIWSKVDLGPNVPAQDQIRPLQGQSPYIINLTLYYDDDQKSGLSGALAYNIFGNRIFSVGDVLYPTIYELPRHSLDITMTKRIGRVAYKLGVQNALDAPFRFYQDSDRNSKIDTAIDHPVFTFRRGQAINLSISYDISKQ
ncbi:MAG: outer membrane beta-barrel protein [Saprospiraceae bacterium]|nr:outer membrane beta-barrel protein [Saprospiraceae bacterium]MDW8482783.1 outer membrane beta-barrel protein [Saprospiraceae bacterium]